MQDEIWKKKVGRRVKVAGVGFGSLVYYGETTLGTDDDGNPISCGVNLEDDLGNCDGTAPDGTQYFDCDEGFGIFTSTNDVTVVDENGVAVKAKKKAPAKKKFDSPPSLRKKINRGGTCATHSGAACPLHPSLDSLPTHSHPRPPVPRVVWRGVAWHGVAWRGVARRRAPARLLCTVCKSHPMSPAKHYRLVRH